MKVNGFCFGVFLGFFRGGEGGSERVGFAIFMGFFFAFIFDGLPF